MRYELESYNPDVDYPCYVYHNGYSGAACIMFVGDGWKVNTFGDNLQPFVEAKFYCGNHKADAFEAFYAAKSYLNEFDDGNFRFDPDFTKYIEDQNKMKMLYK